MLHKVVKYEKFVHLIIIGPELNRETLEAGYHLLDKYANNFRNQGVICDYTNIKSVNLKTQDYNEISDALVVFFLNNENFKLIDVIDNNEILSCMKFFPDTLNNMGINRLLVCPDIESAKKILQSS